MKKLKDVFIIWRVSAVLTVIAAIIWACVLTNLLQRIWFKNDRDPPRVVTTADYRTFTHFSDDYYFETHDYFEVDFKASLAPVFLIQGNCVDKAIAILNILERHKPDLSGVKVAVGRSGNVNHAQVVLTNNDQIITYLDLKNLTVLPGENEFNEVLKLYNPDLFIQAASIYPEMNILELEHFVNKKREN